ncbi:MAG: putative metallophosphoesterase YhaO [Firmicutes bacterium ADurb.Bin506]|nr:MAG: putative metallophosphoesterase YhaO [Firmicutes bacterium ADurb.Bin506]
MKPIYVLHISDLHLDHPLPAYGLEARRERRAELIRAFDFIVDKAVSFGVDVLLVAGDLICARCVSDSTLAHVAAGFARLGDAGVPVVCVPGEAEEYAGMAALLELAAAPNVHLFAGDEWSAVEPIPGVSVWGVRTTGRNADIAVLGNLRLEGPGVHIGLMHATTEDEALGRSIGRRGLATVTSAQLAASGLTYLALGHYHSVLNCSAGTSTCWYPGSPAHHDFSTRGERHVLKVTIEDSGVEVSRTVVPGRSHRVIVIDVTGKTADSIRHRLAGLANGEHCLMVQLEGELSPALSGLPLRLEREFASSFFHLSVVDNTRIAAAAPPRGSVESAVARRIGTDSGLRTKALAIAFSALEEVKSTDRREDRSVG